MSQRTDQVAVTCPACSPDLETVHEVLSEGGGRETVRCTECDHVHKEPLDSSETVERNVVVSQDGESFTTTVSAPATERVHVGEEFIVETEEAIMQVRVTDIEVGPEKRVPAATVTDVETFWTRAVDNVSVDVTMHPREGSRDLTRSVTLYVPGDFEFVVGETVELGEQAISVTGLHVRETAIDRYPFTKLGDEGDSVEAKDVKRVYGYDETGEVAWSAW